MSRRHDPNTLTPTTCPTCHTSVLTVTPEWPLETYTLDPTPLDTRLEAACLILARASHAITGWDTGSNPRWSHQRINPLEPWRTRLTPHNQHGPLTYTILPAHTCHRPLGVAVEIPREATIAEMLANTAAFLFSECAECGNTYSSEPDFHAAHKEITATDPWATQYACALF